jgi:hypothetical protein
VVGTEERIEAVESRSYVVPTEQPEADGTLSWTTTPVVVGLARCAGSTGLGWT